MADNSARLEQLETKVDKIPERVVTALQSAQGTRGAEVPSPLADQIVALTQKLSEMGRRIDAVNDSITSPTVTAIVGETFFQHPGKSFAYAVPSTFSMPKVNVINAWRMWHGGSKRCGETGREKVRPFKSIPEEHLLAVSKKVMRNWRMWKRVMDHLCDRLDDLKRKGIYDWKETLLYLAKVIPAAPQEPGRYKRTVVASMNTVGTVSKNMSRARNQ